MANHEQQGKRESRKQSFMAMAGLIGAFGAGAFAGAKREKKEPRFYAGLFRLWGWGKKELINPPESGPEHRWAGLAEWLRVAHSLLDERPTLLATPIDPASSARIE